MAKFTPYALTALPVSGIDVNGTYFIKSAVDTKFKIYIRKADNSDWVSLGMTNSVDSVNSLIGAVQLELALSVAGVLSITGGSTTIDLDARFDKKTDGLAWSRLTGKPTTLSGFGITDAALDSTVLHKTGAETKAGVLTLSNSPIIPSGANANEAVNKSQLDGASSGLQTQIDNLVTQVAQGMRVPTDINCSANPNYPASTKGDGYVVTVAGKIGGASGVDVRVGAEIRCKVTSAAGTHAAVGANFYILESDLDQATETVAGFAKVATQAITDTGTNDTDFITAKKLQKKNDDLTTANNAKFVRVDASQSFSGPQKTQGRANIGAADDSAVVHNTGNETVAGIKTFSTSPIVPNATTSSQAAAFGQISVVGDAKFVRFDTAAQGLTAPQQSNARTNIDAASTADVSWGGTKEW